MPKTVAVMRGLDEIAEALRRNGIRVVDIEDVNEPISAMVYSSAINYGRLKREHPVPATESLGGGVDDLVLMLNADNLEVEEIVARVKEMW